MDTKLKRFSRSRGVKAALVILYIICFAAMGAVTGYIPAYRYGDGGAYEVLDIMFCDSFEDTDIYGRAMTELEYDVSRAMLYNTEITRELCDRGDMYLKVTYKNGKVIESQNRPQTVYGVPFSAIQEGTAHFSFIGSAAIGYRVTQEVDTIEMGLSASDYIYLRSLWVQEKTNLWIIAVTDLCLALAGLILLCMLCRVSGEDREGNISVDKAFHCFYEIPLITAAVLTVYLFPLCFYGINSLQRLADGSNAGKVLYMALCGGYLAAYSLVWLYFFLCISLRSKEKTVANGSVVFRILRLVVRFLRWCGKGIVNFFVKAREALTGELYKGSATKKFVLMDIALVGFTLVMLFLLFATDGDLLLLIIILEVIAGGLFLYGRFLIHRDAAILEKQINDMYAGRTDFSEELSKNSPYADASGKLRLLGEQYRRGIEESVKAERMKIDLVTNVSHDLKTPLTSIISYVELLSKEELPPAAEDYVKILRQKSERLKNIVADVFELAKTTSGEIEVSHEQIDLAKLSWQTLGEMEDKIKNSGFELKTKISEEPVYVLSDGKRIYRIIQNLMDNALKYSLAGTRIYYTLEKTPVRAVITIKNISAYEMDFTPEEIMERFSRGDKSRTTEGSGLGLSIAQGFALACGGSFDVDIDGDMFKAILSFPLSVNQEPAPKAVTVQPAQSAETVTADE